MNGITRRCLLLQVEWWQDGLSAIGISLSQLLNVGKSKLFFPMKALDITSRPRGENALDKRLEKGMLCFCNIDEKSR